MNMDQTVRRKMWGSKIARAAFGRRHMENQWFPDMSVSQWLRRIVEEKLSA